MWAPFVVPFVDIKQVGGMNGALTSSLIPMIGALAAHWISQQPSARAKFASWHTAAINIGGSFILGGITSAASTTTMATKTPLISPRMKLCWGVGFCGSFTTFSTYSVDVVQWMMQGQMLKATAYIMTNNVGGVAAAAVGLVLVKKLLGG